MKTGLSKKQKVTEVYFNEKDSYTEIYTHNTNLKKRLLAYSAKYPELCKQTDDDGQGGLRFEIVKERFSIRLTAPYSQERRDAASKLAMKTNTFKDAQYGSCSSAYVPVQRFQNPSNNGADEEQIR